MLDGEFIVRMIVDTCNQHVQKPFILHICSSPSTRVNSVCVVTGKNSPPLYIEFNRSWVRVKFAAVLRRSVRCPSKLCTCRPETHLMDRSKLVRYTRRAPKPLKVQIKLLPYTPCLHRKRGPDELEAYSSFVLFSISAASITDLNQISSGTWNS